MKKILTIICLSVLCSCGDFINSNDKLDNINDYKGSVVLSKTNAIGDGIDKSRAIYIVRSKIGVISKITLDYCYKDAFKENDTIK